MTNDPPSPSPETRCEIWLTADQLRPELVAAFPRQLRAGLQYHGPANREEYRQLTGDESELAFKLSLAAAAATPAGPIVLTAETALWETSGWRSMQAQAIYALLLQNRQTPPAPENQAAWQALAKTSAELTAPAIKFLLQLTALAGGDPFAINYPQVREAAKQAGFHLSDFAHSPNPAACG